MNRHHIDIIRLSRGCVLRVSRCCRGCRGAVEGVEALSRVSRVSRLDPRHGQNMGSEKAVEFVSRLVSRLCRGCVELLCRGVEAGAQAERCDMCELTGGCVLFWVEILWDRWMY